MAGSSFEVDPSVLTAGAGKVQPLTGRVETIATGLADTFAGLIAAAGDPGLVGALGDLDAVCARRMLDVAALYGHIGESLADNARGYQDADESVAARMHHIRMGF